MARAKSRKRNGGKSRFHLGFLAPARIRESLGRGWMALKKELKIPHAGEIESLRDRAEWLEKKIARLRVR